MQFIITVYLLLFCCLVDVKAERDNTVLTVPNNWKSGEWGPRWFCPEGYAIGFRLKVEPYQGPFNDDSGLNAITLICSDGKSISSSMGKYGKWTIDSFCEYGYLSSFSLRVARYNFMRDNTAANNIKFTCNDGAILEGFGHAWGVWSPWSQSCRMVGICGIRTKLDNPFAFDRTQLNDVEFYCC